MASRLSNVKKITISGNQNSNRYTYSSINDHFRKYGQVDWRSEDVDDDLLSVVADDGDSMAHAMRFQPSKSARLTTAQPSSRRWKWWEDRSPETSGTSTQYSFKRFNLFYHTSFKNQSYTVSQVIQEVLNPSIPFASSCFCFHKSKAMSSPVVMKLRVAWCRVDTNTKLHD